MKIIITESQFVNMFFKRRFNRIEELITEKMKNYPPCDYTYDPYYAWYDYYGDVRNGVIHEIVRDTQLEWEEKNFKKLEELMETMDELIYPMFYDKVREYYDKVQNEGCEE